MADKKRVKAKSATLSQNYYALVNGKLEKKETTQKRKAYSATLGHAGDKSSISGLGYVGGKLLAGIGGTFEGAADFIGGLFGSDEYEEYLYIYDTPIQDFHETLDKAYDPGKVGRFVGDVASGLGQSATFLIPYAGQAIFFMGAAGNSISSAAQKTGKVGFKEYAYGIGSAAMEWALERYIGGAGNTLESITKKGAKNLGTKLTKHIGKTAAKKTAGKMIASQLISSSVGEGMEEFFSYVGDYALLHATGVDNNATFDWGDAFYTFAVGTTSGTLMGGVSTGLQTAYETKSGSQINQNDKRREIMLTEARELVTKGKNLSGGSDAVATHLSTIEAMLKAYDGASDKKSHTANLALGKINSALMSAEFNIITDRHAAYVAQNATEELADYATALFKDVTGETVTVKMLKDINNEYTRALATMDWAGNVVRGIVGSDAKLTQEMADAIEKELAGKQAAADKKAQADAYQKDFAEKTKETKAVSEASTWNGEAVTYHTTINGEEAHLAIHPEEDGSYSISMYSGGARHDLPTLSHLPMEMVKEILSNASQNKNTDDASAESAEGEKNATEANKRSQEEQTVAQDEKTAESAKKQGETSEEAVEEESGKKKRKAKKEAAAALLKRKESGEGAIKDAPKRKLSLGEEQAPSAEDTKERAQAVKETLLSEEGIIGSEEEVKRATKLVKGFKMLAAPERNAIIRMMRSAGGIEKATLSSLAHLIAIRPGLNVLFAEGVEGEGSHTELASSARLILLDPTLKHGKKYRADVIFHELYHDMASTGDLRTLTKAVVKSTSAEFRRKIADRYTKHANGISISEWLNGKPYTKANYNAYFTEHKDISRATVEEEIAAACMAKVMGSSRFIKEYGGNVGIIRRIYYGLTRTARAIANRSVELDGEVDSGFTLTFRDVLEYKRAYEVALLASQYQMSEKDLTKLSQLMQDRDEADVERAKRKLALRGYAEDGKGMYESNFPKGTPKSAKAERILKYIQDVWSKKPITLKIKENGVEREIKAEFDPTYSDVEGVRTDASKLMGGNRHGKASEQRVTLDLADDYYQIASESKYNYSKDETGKDTATHQGVKRWHYFINDIYFAEYGSEEYAPYRVTINIKEKDNGNFVYTFSAEEQAIKKEDRSAQQTLHAVVSDGETVTNARSSDNSVSQPDGKVKRKLSLGEEAGEPYDLDAFFAEQLKRYESEMEIKLKDALIAFGFKPEQAEKHLSIYKKGKGAEKEKDAGKSRQRREGVKAYTKKEVAKTLEDAIVNVLQPIVGGDVILKGKKKDTLISELFSRMNGAKPSERGKIARKLAEEVLAMTVYDDYEINAEYETMLIDGTIDNFNAVDSFRNKITAKHVKEEIYHRVGKKYGNVILNRWANAENGISPNDAVHELQSQGILADLDSINEADIILRLNAEYEHLKERSEMRRELIPLAALDPEEYNRSLNAMTNALFSLFEEGGRETKYGKVIRRYRELLGKKEVEHMKELNELRAKLTNEMEKRIKRIHENAEHSRQYWQERAGDARMGRDDAQVTSQLVVAVKGLREFLNRDYTPASEGQDIMNKNVSRLVTKSVNRTKVHAAPAIEAARIVKEWADFMKDPEKGDPNFIGETVLHSTMTAAQYEAISRLAAIEVKDDTKLTVDQKRDLLTLIYVIKNAYNHKDEVFKDGKWVSIEEDARRAIANAEKEAGEEGGKFKKLAKKAGKWIKKGALMYMDPLGVAAHIDNYSYDGVMQAYFREIATAEARANVMMQKLREPFEKFFEEHKKYSKRLAEDKITLKNGIEITVGQAITLSEMFKRDQAKAGLMLSRIGFHFDDGTSKEIEGFGKPTFVEAPNGTQLKLKDATANLASWKHDRIEGVKALKALGYNTEGDKNINAAFADFEARVTAAESNAQKLMDDFGLSREAIISDMEKKFTKEDREFIKVVSHFFNTTSKQVKTEADMKNLGYTNVISGYYFPIKRMKADMDQSITAGELFSEFITTENLSFNQKTQQGAKASIEIYNVWDVLTDHISGLARWENLYLPIQNLNKLYNYNVSDGTTNVVSLKNTLEKREDFNYHAYLSDLMLDVQNARKRETKTVLDKGVNTLRGGYAQYQLGLNPKTIAKQILSLAAAGQFASIKNIAKGVAIKNADKMNQYSVMAAERDDNATVVKAYSNTEKLSKAMEFTTKGITWMDRKVNLMIWTIAQNQIADTHPDVAVGSEKFFQLAGEMTDEMILFVQDSSDAMTKSQAARSSSEIVKGTTMFASSSLKMFSRIVENVGFFENYRSLSKEDQAKYASKYSHAKKQLARSVGSMAAVAVLTALIARLFSFFYNDDRNQEEETAGDLAAGVAKDAASEVFGFIPVIGDVAGYFMDGYDVSNFYYDTYNDLLVAVSDTYSLLGKAVSGEVIEEWEIGRMLRKNARALGSLSGVPVRNVENTLVGMVNRFSPETGYTYETLFYNAQYTADINKALKRGDTELASAILELAVKRNKTGSVYSPEVIDTIVKLHNAGYNAELDKYVFKVLPRDIDTEKVTTRKQYRQFEKIYSQADEFVEALVKSEEFAALADYSTEDGNAQAMAINTVFSAYYEIAEHEVLGKELTKKAAVFTVSENPTQLLLVKAYEKALSMGVVETTLTKKKALLKYMQELGMDKTSQAWAEWLCGYRSEDVSVLIEKALAGRENEKELRLALGIDKAEKEAA